MTNLTHPKLIWLKGMLFVVLGLLASALLVARSPHLSTIGLLCLAIWAFCRAYYFAFYVIERYVDRRYRFAGLTHFARYAFGIGAPDQDGAEEPGDV